MLSISGFIVQISATVLSSQSNCEPLLKLVTAYSFYPSSQKLDSSLVFGHLTTIKIIMDIKQLINWLLPVVANCTISLPSMHSVVKLSIVWGLTRQNTLILPFNSCRSTLCQTKTWFLMMRFNPCAPERRLKQKASKLALICCQLITFQMLLNR